MRTFFNGLRRYYMDRKQRIRRQAFMNANRQNGAIFEEHVHRLIQAQRPDLNAVRQFQFNWIDAYGETQQRKLDIGLVCPETKELREGIEVKSGNALYQGQQREADQWLRDQRGIPITLYRGEGNLIKEIERFDPAGYGEGWKITI